MLTRRRAVVTGGAVIAALSIGGGLLLAGSGDEAPGPTPVAVAVPAPVLEVTPKPTPTPTPKPKCTTAERTFVPTAVNVPSVDSRIPVIPMPRDARNVPGVPALTGLGKSQMAFDLGGTFRSGILPGAGAGNALFNAHTWPDGSALGNKLLAGLQKGDPINVAGPGGRICYQVTDRVEVPSDDEGARYYARTGKPQIAIVVCSGQRLGPGNWSKRTIWYASPVKD